MNVRMPIVLGILLLLVSPAAACRASTPRVVVYVTYSTCSICPSDPLRERYERYTSELWAALREMGVQVRTIDVEPELRSDLAALYEEFGLPEEMRAMFTLVVSVDGRFLFVNHVPVRLITDFLSRDAERYGRVAVFRDEARDLYLVMDDQGNVGECKVANSIAECLSGLGVRWGSYPWSFLALVVVSGLLDGVNPCAFAVLLFLVTLLFAIGTTTWKHPERVRRMLGLFGLTYILAVYLAYLTVGLALRHVLAMLPFPHLVRTMGALAVIAAGVIKVKDYFRPGRGISLKPTAAQWETARKWMGKAALPATFITGALVALFEFPCTGGIYLVILSMLATRTTFVESLAYLVLYNAAFILPLVAVLVLASRREILEFSIKRWQQREGRKMGLAEGLVYIGLGAFLLLSGLL